MANYITIFLFVGGAVGWTLFALAFVQLQHSRRKELEMIKEISKELKTVKEEIKLLTTGTIK